MKINVTEIPSSTWKLEDETFFCTHDERTIVDYTNMTMGPDGPIEHTSEGYECADEDCREALDGSPEEDAIDEDWEREESREY